ncbi:MAG: class I SAM-dependent methyltransferase, partial [Alphaproteobacteria bacterium]|nr:class I SAM-dependent methyltransferase [Alphaproteobacteria bacterium]
DDSYYRRADPLGARGDFVTAPEISQIFGELIGLWCVDVWQKLGAPKTCTLVELGPGRGTLMKDALRAARVAPSFMGVVSVAMVEVGEALRRLQQDALREAPVAARWLDRFEDLDVKGPVIVIANEFFDALPIRQWVRGAAGWSERCVGFSGDTLVFGASGPIGDRLVPSALRDAPFGSIVETSPARAAIARMIGEAIKRNGGAALVIDYGFVGPAAGDTLQAMKAHAYADALADPGHADVTSHVDFAALQDAFVEEGAAVLPLVTQGAFLNRLGARERVEALKQSASAAQADDLDAAYARLTGDMAMGSLFKVLCAHAPATLEPVGFSGA